MKSTNKRFRILLVLGVLISFSFLIILYSTTNYSNHDNDNNQIVSAQKIITRKPSLTDDDNINNENVDEQTTISSTSSSSSSSSSLSSLLQLYPKPDYQKKPGQEEGVTEAANRAPFLPKLFSTTSTASSSSSFDKNIFRHEDIACWDRLGNPQKQVPS